MKRIMLLLTLVLASFVVAVRADCPTTATCAEHGIAGYPTGQYLWQGSTEYTQFHHVASGDAPAHSWWEKCN
jgi:hypothetical protein